MPEAITPRSTDAPRVRPLRAGDEAEWLRLRCALWPDADPAELAEELSGLIAAASLFVPVLDRGDGRLGGFAEIGERSVAAGCDSSPVAYLEAWYVDADLRRRGYAAALLRAGEDWARARGYREMGSDALLANPVSHAAHAALGFEEVDRVVVYAKRL